MSAFENLMTALQDRGEPIRAHHGKARTRGICHDGDSPDTVSIEIGRDKNVVIWCHKCQGNKEFLGALGMSEPDLYDEPRKAQDKGIGTVVASYAYADAGGVIRYYVDRYFPKTFRPRMADGSKGFPREARILYHLPEVLREARAGGTIFVCEGEKDADNLIAKAGVVATSMPGGTGMGWLPSYSEALKGAGEVVIIADRDADKDTGIQHARKVAASLAQHGIPHRIVLPAVGKDISDHLAAGLGYRALVPLDEGNPAHHSEDWPEEVPGEDEETTQAAYEREVEAEVRRLRIREEASRRLRRERTETVGEPDLVTLDDFLAVEDEETRYRIEGLWPVGGRVLPSAQYKAGKTTLRDNLVRALADKEDFLGTFPVVPPEGRIVIIDNELDERMLRRWLREQRIVNTNRVAVISLRGKVSTFDILDPDTRTRWASKIRAAEGSIVILDCLRPVLDALGLSEDKEAGRFLVAFDAMLDEAGASEAAVIHHMGHSGERSRGDSRLLDWPDVTWRLVRDKGDDGETNPSAPRYFSAYGRDVDVPEGLLEFDPAERRLSLVGGSRRDAKAAEVLPALYAYLRAHPGASKNSIEKVLVPQGHVQKDVRKALAHAVAAGKVDVAKGPRNSDLHTIADGITESQFVSSSAPRQRGHSDFVSSSIDDELKSRSDQRDHRDEVTQRSKDGDLGQCQICGGSMVILTEGQTRHLLCEERTP